MAFSRKHAYQSPFADGGEALLQPSNWNADFVVAGATVGGIPYCPTATTETTSANLTFINDQLLLADESSLNNNPSLAFANQINTGFRRAAESDLRIMVAGADAIRILVGQTQINGSLSLQTSANDIYLNRISAGLASFGTAAGTGFAGRLKLTSIIAAGVAVGSLNAAPTTGEIQSVTDALAPAAGAAVAAGGAAKALVWYNGAQWTVIGV